MPFNSWQSYWRFRTAVTNSSRYIFDEETNQFLSAVLETCTSRQKLITKGAIFWRSQLGGSFRQEYDDEGNELGDVPCPHPVERMKPLKFASSEGRANPKGIPYLYLATTKETAMSEARPWIGSEISVGQFKVKSELRIIDCSLNHFANPLYIDLERGFYEPSDEEKEKSVWAHIDRAFSEPVTQNENQAHYVPTQIIAELFKKEGFDGIAYKSMLSDGHNVVLFDPEMVDMLNCFLFKTKKVCFEFCEAANPYFIRTESET